MAESLDDIRKEIEIRRDRWAVESRIADQNHALAIAELQAFDRAVAAMERADRTLDGTPARKERRDIAALVLAALTDEPQTVVQIAHAIGVQPSRVLTALAQRGYGKARQDAGDGWVRAGDE